MPFIFWARKPSFGWLGNWKFPWAQHPDIQKSKRSQATGQAEVRDWRRDGKSCADFKTAGVWGSTASGAEWVKWCGATSKSLVTLRIAILILLYIIISIASLILYIYICRLRIDVNPGHTWGRVKPLVDSVCSKRPPKSHSKTQKMAMVQNY